MAKAAAPKTQAATRAAEVASNTTAQNLSAWEQAKNSSKKSRSGTTCSEGNYVARLSAARLVDCGDAGHKPVFTMTIFDHPEEEGKTAERWSTPIESDDPQQLDYMARDLRNLGVTNLDELPHPQDWLDQDALDAIVAQAPAAHITVRVSKTDTSYMNVYINKPVLGDEGADESAAPVTEGDDGGEAEAEAEEPVAEEEEVVEEEAVEEAAPEIEAGTSVTWDRNGEAKTGTVVRLEADGAKAVVRPDDSNTPVRIDTTKLTAMAVE